MRKAILLLVMALLLATGCTAPSVASTQAQFCQDLAELDQSLKAMPPLTSSTTVGEVKGAVQQVRAAWNNVKQSAGNVGQAYMTELEAAENDLNSSVGELPDNTTLGQAAAELFPKVTALSEARARVSSEARCGS